jgi:RNA polymerase sigma-70 factor (ECF subfamily)
MVAPNALAVDYVWLSVEQTLAIVREATATTEGRVPAERLGKLFDAHHARLYALARRLSSDPEEARDLVQEAFLRVARRPRRIPDSESGAEAWLVRTLVNLCRDRRRRLRVRGSHRDNVAPPPRPADPESRAVARATIEAALARLPARTRAVVVMREIEELDTADVARLLGISRATVRWHLHRGKRELKRILIDPRVSP